MYSSVYEEVVVHIRPLQEQIKVEMRKKGVSSIKNISLDDLVNSITDSKKDSKVVSTGFLPENCLSVKISDKLKSVVIWHPRGRCDYTYFNTLYEDFPMPCLVFGFDIDVSGKVKDYRMAVLDDEKPKPSTRLYEYPFSNVYRDTRICIGAANSLPVYEHLHTLASLPNLVLSIPNNDQNFNRENNRPHLDYRELLDHLRDKEPSYYYEHILVPRKDGKTLRDFIDRNI